MISTHLCFQIDALTARLAKAVPAVNKKTTMAQWNHRCFHGLSVQKPDNRNQRI